MTNEEKPRVVGADVDAKAGESKAEVNKGRNVGPIVEDTTVVGGTGVHGEPRIVPKTPDGRVQEDVKPTDPNED